MRFYATALGWEWREATTGPAGSLRAVATLHERTVAGLRTYPGEGSQERDGWRYSVSVGDIGRTLEAADPAGGTVVRAAAGARATVRSAVIRDPVGAEIVPWEAGDDIGAQLAKVVGA